MSSACTELLKESGRTRSFAFRAYLPYLLLTVAAGSFLYPFVRVLTWTPDGGVFIYGAERVLDGDVPSHDFIELQGPGSFYWLALFFKIFGATTLTARAVLFATGIATVLLVFYLARRLSPGITTGVFAALFVLVTGLPLMVVNSPHYDSNLFALAAVAVFVSVERRIACGGASERSIFVLLFAAGLLAGITSCCLQQKGLNLVLAFVVCLGILHRRPGLRLAAILCSGYACVVAVELSLYAAAGALHDLIYVNLLWPLSTYQSVNAAPYGFPLWEIWFPNWFQVLRADFVFPVAIILTAALSLPFLLILTLPLLLALLAYFSRARFSWRAWLPYVLSGYALWAAEIHRLDMGHLRNGSVILIVLFFALCEIQSAKAWRRVAATVAACILLNGAADLFGAMVQHTPIHSRRGTLFGNKPDAALDFLLTHTAPGEPVFVYPYQPIYYFLAGVRNPTRFSSLMYHINTDAQFQEAVRDLERKKVRYVLWDTGFSAEKLASVFPAYRHPASNQLIMEPYFETHYRQIAVENGFRVLERIPDR